MGNSQSESPCPDVGTAPIPSAGDMEKEKWNIPSAADACESYQKEMKRQVLENDYQCAGRIRWYFSQGRSYCVCAKNLSPQYVEFLRGKKYIVNLTSYSNGSTISFPIEGKDE